MEKQEELCAEVNKRAPLLLESGEWTDCKFEVGAEPRKVVIGGYKLVMALASPVFAAMFYGGLAETRDHIRIVDVEPEIFIAMLRYIYTGSINLSSCNEASELCYAAKKYLLHHLADECSSYLWNNVNLGNVCQLYEHSLLFEDAVLTQKCINIFTENTKELLQDSSFTDAPLSTVEKIFSLNELNIDSEADLINAAALYASAQDKKAVKIASDAKPCTVSQEDISMNVDNNFEGAVVTKDVCEVAEQPSPGPSNMTHASDTVGKQKIRSVVRHIRFLTLTPQQYTDCTARSSLLTLLEDHALLVNIVSKKLSVPMPNGLSTSTVHREKVDKARSEGTFRYTVHDFSSLENEVLSPVFYVRNLPWQIKIMPRALSQQTKSLGFFVQCSTESESSSWSCSANAELRLICHKPGAEPFFRKIQHVYTTKENDWGFSHFLQWDTVLDPAQGYIKDGAITLEVHVAADEPQGVI